MKEDLNQNEISESTLIRTTKLTNRKLKLLKFHLSKIELKDFSYNELIDKILNDEFVRMHIDWNEEIKKIK